MRLQLHSVALTCASIAMLSACVSEVPVPMSADVLVSDRGACTVLSKAVACRDVGPTLRRAHAPDSCVILVNPDVSAPYEAVVEAVSSLQREHFTNVSFAPRSKVSNGGT
jgi:biopolymer transport protein ExbD